MAKVLLKYKNEAPREIFLNKKIIAIGRKPDNDIIIDNQAVSGHHAIIETEGDSLFIEDLKSLNGTFVNSRKITRVELYHKDVVLVGVHTLEVIQDIDPAADKKADILRGRSMFETVVITPEEQKKIIIAANRTIPDALGGFVILEGASDQKDYIFREKVSVIGKEKGSIIRLQGLFAPKRAALVNRRKEGYFITPSGKKPVRINGQEINRRYDLQDGDIVEIGKLKMQFYLKDYHAKPTV